jgi:hypothetical protein
MKSKKASSTKPPVKKRAKKLPIPGSAIYKSMVLCGIVKEKKAAKKKE